ncbi:putative C6 finger domain-containing protein [Venturia nashicola]|uniref:Putative C6 finger domain-containing protein n=1 Tax=Venturia nashicola TaxID=86259 RepID=A0A4Z1P2A6_9PEZI|nr:putative C6 finger domain-containing protein [Venturia nashicola]TLD35672.1 putative C6 finger domain-containing protein [Venturia nashicola]
MAAPALPDIDSFSLHLTVYVAPENVDKLLKAMEPVFDHVSAEEGCTFFELYQDPASPGTLSWIENWSVSPEWFMANQVTKEYYKEYFAITEPLFIKPREFKILKRVGKPFLSVKDSNFK